MRISRQIRGRFRLTLERKLLMAEVAVAGDDAGIDDTRGDGRRIGGKLFEEEEELGGGGKDEEAGDDGDRVDGEAAKPFLEVIAFGAEDEVLVTEEGDGDADGLRDDGGNVRDDWLGHMGHRASEDEDTQGVEAQREAGVECP